MGHSIIKMVGESRKLVLEDILSEKQIEHILKQSIGDVTWVYKGCEVRPAADGIAGFLGDHMKAVLRVYVGENLKEVHLFLKRIPKNNEPKAEFIAKNHYFRREQFMYRVIEEILCDNDPHPWSIKAHIFTDSMVVLPDLTHQKYKPQNLHSTLDFQHALIATNSIARFHAAYVNYETKKSIELKRPYSTLEEVGDLLREPTFCNSPWLKTCSKLSTNLLKKFSKKSYYSLPDLESRLSKLYLKACDSLTEYKNTLNSIIHKDLWVNNIMFKYDNNTPINAILIDYQCLRYGPPAFDLMTLLYLTTSSNFRSEYETKIFDYYFTIFTKNLDDESKERLNNIGYDKNDFLKWCDKARMFGIFEAIGIFPYILMDSKSAQATFDDPETYEQNVLGDRTDPVLAYCLKCEPYKQRNLEVIEEFVERYLM